MEWLRLIGARLGIGLLFTCAALTVWVSYLHHQRQVEMHREMERAREISSSLEAMLSTLKDAELGERGYLITGQPEYLEPYRAARRKLPGLIGRLKARIAADPIQQQRLQAIEPLVSIRLDELQQAIDVRRERGFEAAEAVVRASGARATMDAVRTRITEAERANSIHLRGHMQPALHLGTLLGTAALSGIIAFGLTSAGFRLGRRKDALEEAIRSNEALLRTVLAQMPSGVVIADASGRLLLGNEQMERIWRQPFRPATTVADYQVYRGFHADRRPYDPEEWPLTRSLRQGETIQEELVYFLRGDNTCGAMEISSAPIRNRSGKIIAGVATFHDISGRHEIERELRRSQRAFKSLVEHLPDVIFRLDPDLRHTYMSPAVEQCTGIEPAAFLGKTVSEMGFDPDGCARFEALCREVRATGEERRFEFTDDGRRHRCRLVAEPGPDGAVESILGISEDITAQERAERALREGEERLRFIVEHSPDCIFIQDPDLRYLWISKPAPLFPLEECLGRTDTDLFGPDEAQRLAGLKRRTMQEKRSTQTELALEIRGRRRCFEAAYEPWLDERGAVAGIAGYIREITERKEAERHREHLLRQLEHEHEEVLALGEQLQVRLREAEEKQRTLDALMEYIPEGIAIADMPDVRVRLVSRHGRRLAGRPSENLEGLSILAEPAEGWGLLHADGNRPAGLRELPLVRAVIGGETITNEEWLLERPDGGRIAVLCNAGPIRDAAGRVTGGILAFRDIAGRKQAEAALRRGEERLRLAQRAANAGVWDWDMAAGRLYWSDETFRLFGLEPGACEPTGEAWLDLVHPDDRPQVKELIASCLDQRQELFDAEYRIIRPDGPVRWVEDRGQIFYDPAGRPVRMLGINIDVSARRQAEEATRRQANLLEQTHDAILVREYGGPIIYWNRGAVALYGYSRDEAIGAVSHELFRTACPDGLDAVEGELRREGRWEGELVHTTRDRRRLTVESRQLLFEESDGTLLILETDRDITERRQAIEQLRLSEERLAMAQEAGGVGVFDWDPVTGEVFWSRQLEAIFGLPPGGFGGRHENWARQVHPEDLPRLERLFRDLLRGEPEEAGWEYRIFRPDGELRWISARGRAIFEPSGNPLRIIGINIDVTRRKLAEQALQEADRRKDEFLAMLAHELRNPLAPIRNAIEVLRRVETADPKQRWAREVLERQVRQLARLVDDLLDVSRITRGKITLKKETLDLRDIVDQAVEISHPLFLARGHALSVALPAEPLKVEGDRARLVQIVSNLLNNAAKYTGDGGRIEVDIEARPEAAIIRVSDNGAGISPELLPHVFDPFRQADETLARSQGGLGVGLTLVRRLVQLHGGRAEAHSEGLGRGSVFTVTLPRAQG